jgi:hypothetical protein
MRRTVPPEWHIQHFYFIFQRALNGDEALFEFNFADAVHRRELQHCTDQQPGLLGVHIAGTFATDQQVEGDFLARGSNSACGVIGQELARRSSRTR